MQARASKRDERTESSWGNENNSSESSPRLQLVKVAELLRMSLGLSVGQVSYPNSLTHSVAEKFKGGII